ncbi:MAG: transporter [Methylobacterium sp.]|uniref:transporter n=1 Tax=unclassified Methylobacterium TaxID=2615210 RepID=UPI00070159BA|nr:MULTISPECIES: transporter [unclassified Methylobacterium]KQP07266.1 CoxB-like protein [Methylobacterium sp. Leaf99]MDO9428629.1 transporter [Methylobacterium sp.]
MMKNWLAAGAVALSVGMSATAAFAQTTTVPGEQVGLATGAPLPEGIYALNTFVYRSNENTGPGSVDVGVNVPVLVWSTPFVPFGGRVELLVAPPTVFAFGKNGGPQGARDLSINVGTFVGGIWAFDLGNNFGVSLLGGVYLNELNAGRGVLVNNNGNFAGAPVLGQLASNTYRMGVAASYTGDGYNLTANLTANIYDSPASFGGTNTVGFGNTRGPFIISDSLNLDLTATKKFGKFEIGAIGYGTMNFDISAASLAAGNRGNFSVGGLIGYDFGPVTAQAYVATTVVNSVRRADTVEGWFRLIVPLYSPTAVAAAPVSPVIRKY